MSWVLKRTVSMRRFFWAPKTYVKNDGLENIYNFRLKIFVYLRQKKNIELLLGHRRIYFKSPALLFYCFLKKKKKKMLFQFLNIIIGNDHVVSLRHCGPMPVILASLFIFDSISGIS